MSSPVTQVVPVSIPTAAGIDYLGGDVRHLTVGDALTYQAISTATRHLAQRDNLLAAKLNDVILQVNNNERLVSTAVPRMLVPAGATEIATNFRIPSGYEARVINATISTVPDSQGKVDVLWGAATYGASEGTAVVSTLAEYEGATQFYGVGEFIVKLTNVGIVPADFTAAVLISLRPVVSIDLAALISPNARGDDGKTGATGEPGAEGNTGLQGATGPPGDPGLVWQGLWQDGTYYNVNDVVRYQVGEAYNAYVCTYAHTADSSNNPDTSASASASASAGASYWDLVVSSGTIVSGSGSGQIYASLSTQATVTLGTISKSLISSAPIYVPAPPAMLVISAQARVNSPNPGGHDTVTFTITVTPSGGGARTYAYDSTCELNTQGGRVDQIPLLFIVPGGTSVQIDVLAKRSGTNGGTQTVTLEQLVVLGFSNF
jgi:hypothetical protein